MKLATFLFATLPLVLSACTQRLTDFTIISTKNVSLNQMAKFKRAGTRSVGEDSKYIIVVIPTGVPNAKEAVDRAIESVPGGVALVDGVLTYKWFYIPYLFGKQSYVVEGTVLTDPSLLTQDASRRTEETPHRIVQLNEEGKILKQKDVSRAEYEQFKQSLSLAVRR